MCVSGLPQQLNWEAQDGPLLSVHHVDVQFITHVGVVLQLAKAKSGNVDSLEEQTRSINCLRKYSLSTYVSRVVGPRATGSVQVAVELLQNVLQPLLGLLVGVDQDGLEIDGQSVPEEEYLDQHK